MAMALLAKAKDAGSKAATKIYVTGAGVDEANGIYSRCESNVMKDGGLSIFVKDEEDKANKNWEKHWYIAYYKESDGAGPGPAWYIQHGKLSAYCKKLSKDVENFEDIANMKVPTTGWTNYQGNWRLEHAKGPVPHLDECPTAEDVKSAIALLEHISEDVRKGCTSQSLSVLSHVAALAKEAVRRQLPGAVVTEPLWDGAKSAKAYNEVRGPRGKCRPAYTSVVEIVEKIGEEEKHSLKKNQVSRIDGFPEKSLLDFKGDNRLYHLPRMLTIKENDDLVRGIAQRASALRHFVIDMYKSRGVEKMDIVRKGALEEEVFRRVCGRAAEKPTRDLVSKLGKQEKVDFSKLYWNVWYGPDIIRGPDGSFYVVEDNVGYVGGFGDLIEARKILCNNFPEFAQANAFGDDLTAKFYDEMGKHYMEQLAPGEKAVVCYYKRNAGGEAAECSDNEDRRMVELLRRRGIVPVPLPGPDGAKPGTIKLEVRNKRVYLVTPPPKKRSLPSNSPPAARRRTASPGKEKPGAGKGLPSASPPAERTRSPAKERPGAAKPLADTSPPAKVAKTSCKNDLAEKSADMPAEEKAKEEPVGVVILLSEPCDVNPGHESTKIRSAIEEGKARIYDYECQHKQAKLLSKGADKSVVTVSARVEFTDGAENKCSLEKKGKGVLWTIADKKGKAIDKIKGPLAWDVLKTTLSAEMTTETDKDGDPKRFKSKLDKETAENVSKLMVVNDTPAELLILEGRMEELKAAIENVGNVVGGNGLNNQGPLELFRVLKRDDMAGWKRCMMSQRGVPNILEAYYAGKVKISNGPGFEILGDKELCAHVDKLIWHYLKEAPILKTIPTESFGGDPKLIHTVFDDPRSQENSVVKRVDGRGGDAVWVGAKLSRSDFMEAKSAVESEPDAFIVQRYTTLSQVDGQLVDLRGPAFFSSTDEELSGGKGVSVSPVLWGRGVPEKGGNGKVNISDAGFQLAIATCPTAEK